MKTFFLTVLVLINISVIAQEYSVIGNTKDTNVFQYYAIEQIPLFNGAKNKKENEENVSFYFKQEIKKYNYYASGDIYISFIINENGKAVDLYFLMKSDSTLEGIAREIIENMPLWKSGVRNNKLINVSYTSKMKF